MKIAVIGGSGFLGRKCYDSLLRENEVVGTYFGRKHNDFVELDATKKEDVESFLHKYKPEVVIDTVALTSSTKCEQNSQLAEELNYTAAKNISEASSEIGAKVFFISTSYVFDGEKGNYGEEDPPNPLNVYGKTKLMAEKEVLKNPRGAVLRVEIMYGYNGKEYSNGVLDTILSGNPIKLREPYQIRQPLFVDDVPRIIMDLANKNATGILHLGGLEKMFIIDFLKELEKLLRPTSIISGGGVAQGYEIKIPHNSTFDTLKARSLGINFTSFEEGLKKLRGQLSA